MVITSTNNNKNNYHELDYLLSIHEQVTKLKERVSNLSKKVETLEKTVSKQDSRLSKVEDITRDVDTTLSRFGSSFKTFFASFIFPILVTLVLKLFGV